MYLLLSLWIKLFFVFTPFFALTMFLSLVEDLDAARRRRLVGAITFATLVICVALFLVGRQMFAVFGITLDSFRVGAGALLLLSGITLARGQPGAGGATTGGDVAVVPMAIPVIVGPATTGTLLVLGAELEGLAEKAVGISALMLAVASVAALLFAGNLIQRALGLRGIAILSRLTGLILTALAAQMMMTGVRSFFLG